MPCSRSSAVGSCRVPSLCFSRTTSKSCTNARQRVSGQLLGAWLVLQVCHIEPLHMRVQRTAAEMRGCEVQLIVGRLLDAGLSLKGCTCTSACLQAATRISPHRHSQHGQAPECQEASMRPNQVRLPVGSRPHP